MLKVGGINIVMSHRRKIPSNDLATSCMLSGEKAIDITGTSRPIKVVSKRDSVLVLEGGHESGWINKVADRDAAAQAGWRSPASNILPGSTGGDDVNIRGAGSGLGMSPEQAKISQSGARPIPTPATVGATGVGVER